MTVRANQIVLPDLIDQDTSNLPYADDTFIVSIESTLGLVRNIMRERSDCNIIPVVNGVFQSATPNKYGDDYFIDVTYHSRGYRATYGARIDLDTNAFRVQCYMD